MFRFRFPLCLDCQRSEVPRPHFRSALTAKNVKFRFRTSALPWLPNMWSSAPALPLCRDWQRSEVPLSALVLPGLPKMWSSASAFHLCLDFQRFAVLLLHFRSILTAKNLKIGFSTNTLPSLPNMGSSASTLPFCLDCKRSLLSHFRSAFIPKDVNALLLCLDCQICEVLLPHFRSVLTGKDLKFRFPHLFCQDFQRCEVPLPHFISAWTSKDLQFRFCTFAQSWLPKIWRSASPLTHCLHCQIWVVPPPHFPSALTAKDLYFHISGLPSFPKMWTHFCSALTAKVLLLISAVGSYYVFPHNFVLSYMND